MQLMPLDLPAPVAPAISMWGVVARSRNTALPAMSLPMATSSGLVALAASGELRRSPSATSWRWWLGTSTPIAERPGMGARMRTSTAAIAYAMSFWRLVTRATLTPGPSSSSYRVTVGPTVIPSSVVSTPCDASDSCNITPRASTALRSIFCSPGRSRNVIGGSTQAPTLVPSGLTGPGWLPVETVGLAVRRRFGAASSPTNSSPSAAKSYRPDPEPASADTSPATSYGAAIGESPVTAPSRSLLSVEMLLIPDLAARPNGAPTAARKPPVF